MPARQPKRKPRRRPLLESLEGRWLPSVDFQFARGVGAVGQNSDIRANAVATDAGGDVFVVGSLRGTANFATGATAVNLQNTGNLDLFVAKYGPTGNLSWAVATAGAGSSSVCQGAGIAVDGSGNVLLTGSFSGKVDFDPGAGTTNLTSVGIGDAFVAKLDGTGKFLWAKDIGGTAGALDAGNAIATDAAGNAYATGYFADNATFGTTTLTTGDNDDAFATEINPGGIFLWAAATHGSLTTATTGNGIAPDGAGGVCVAGSFSGKVDFDPGAGTTTLTSGGSTDGFLWRLGPGGTLTWAEAFGGSDFDQANAVAMDPSGNVYTTGTFSGTADFDPTASLTTLTAGGANDVFVAKYAPTGRLTWARSFVGSAGPSVGRAIALDGAGDVITGGDFSGTVNFDPTGGSHPLASAGSTDIFASVLDGSGHLVAVQAAGGTGFDAGMGLAANSAGSIAIAGRYTGPATFGATTLPKLGAISIDVALLAPGSTPNAPSAPILEVASDSGALGDGLTSSTHPTFDVTQAQANDLVELLRDGVVVGSRTGPGAIQDPGPVPDGSHAYSARQTSLAGLVSPPSTALALVIDATPPVAPSALVLASADDTGTIGDGLTSARSPHLAGTAEPGATVQILDANQAQIASGTAASDGTFSLQPTNALADGKYTLAARATDAAGNMGPTGPTFALTIDGTAPLATSVLTLLPADDTGTLGDGITSIRRPHLTGTAEAGSSVQVVDGNGTAIATGTAGADGTFSITPANALIDGRYTFAARATDAAGNVGPTGPTFTLTIDGTAPAAPSVLALLPADDTGTQGDGITAITRPHLTGTAAAGATVQVVDGSGNVVATATAGADGSFVAQPLAAFAQGSYTLSARATDVAGNVSPAGPALRLTIAGTPPPAPSALSLPAADDTGVVGDGRTSDRRPHLDGTATPSVTVQLVDSGGNPIGSVVAGADGSFSVQPTASLADGNYSLSARVVNAAGVVGPTGPAFSLAIDGTSPAAPSVLTLLPADDSGILGDGRTSVREPHLTGTAEPGATVQVLDSGNNPIATAVAGPDGSFSAQPSSPLADGSYSLSARAIDVAGNVGPTGASLYLTISGTAPPAPSALALSPADDTGTTGDGITADSTPHLTGTARPGITVQVVDAAGNVVATVAAGADGSFSALPAVALADGTYILAARAIDAAGNIGPTGPPLAITILAHGPSTPAAPALALADDTGIKGDGITSVRHPHLVGKVGPGLAVDLLDATGMVVATTMVGADGSYTFQVPNALPVGVKSWSVRARDVAGNVSATGATLALKIIGVANDFDGDGKADVSAYDPATATWTVQFSGGGTRTLQFGQPGDIPIPADYDGDGKADFAVYRPSNSTFYIALSGGGVLIQAFGAANLDIPIPADYDGDGKADIATYRPSTAQWSILDSGGGGSIFSFGAYWVDIPIPADYDGDGKADIATFRTSTAEWSILYSGGGGRIFTFGAPGLDVPVPADYDGDGKADIATYRSITSEWSILNSGGGGRIFAFGAPSMDIPAPADYDGDGKADVGTFRPPTAGWAILLSGGGALVPTVGPSMTGLPLDPPQAYRPRLAVRPDLLKIASVRVVPAAVVESHAIAASRPTTIAMAPPPQPEAADLGATTVLPIVRRKGLRTSATFPLVEMPATP